MHKWLALLAVCLGAFMLLVDVTIVTVALPDIGRDLGASLTGLQWVLDAYALALAALLLGAGSLADRWGRRRMYLTGLVVFAAASLACGLAPNADVLLATRAVQGVGAAAMFASSMALLNLAYQGRDRATAFGVWGAVLGVAAAAGPIAGGLLTEHLGWRAIFLVNLPVSVVAIVVTVRALAESRDPQAHRVDLPGILTFTAGAGLLTYGLIETSPLWCFAGSAALVAFVVVERLGDHPMLDLTLLGRVDVAGIMLGATFLSAAAFASSIYTSLWLQAELGLGAVAAGLALLPMPAAALIGSGVGVRLMARIADRWTIGVGMLVIGAGSLLQALVGPGSGWVALTPGLAVCGLGVGIVSPALSAAALAAAPRDRAGMAAGAVNTFRQLGMALGVGALGIVFTANTAPGGEFTAGLDAVYLSAGASGIAAGLLVILLLRRRAGAAPPSRVAAG